VFIGVDGMARGTRSIERHFLNASPEEVKTLAVDAALTLLCELVDSRQY
jgi:hypothetical protein